MKKPSKTKVLVGLILMQTGFLGVSVNCISMLLPEIIRETGFPSAKIFLYFTIRSLTTALLVVPGTRLFTESRDCRFLAVLGLLSALGTGCIGFFRTMLQWYLLSFVSGAGACIIVIAVPLLVENWYPERKGTVNGLVLSASGLSAALLSPVCAAIISSRGWRVCALVLGGVTLVTTVLPAMCMLSYYPGDGAQETKSAHEQPKLASTCSAEPPETGKVTALLIGLIHFSITFAFQFTSLVTTVAASYGYPLMVTALVSSLMMIGNVGGKLIFGVVSDRWGVFRTAVACCVLIFSATLLMCLAASSQPALFSGALLFGIIYSAGTIMLSLLYQQVFGIFFHKTMSRISSVCGILCAFASPVFAAVHDVSGSFTPPILLCAGLILLAALCILLLQFRYRQHAMPQAHPC